VTRIKYGIAGASGIARRRAIPAFRNCQRSSLTAICSRSLQRATALAQEFNANRAFDDLETMLDHVDAVYVATPVHCHLDDARKVLAAGKHLLLEKPLARTVDEARQIQALIPQGTFAMEGYMMKFHAAHADIRKAVQGGSIGSVVQARARLGCWYPDISGAWRQDPGLAGGGALMDLGSHLIDLLRWILGPIRSVRALCNTQIFSYAVEDSATVILEFETGAHAIVEAYFSMPDRVGTGMLELTGTQGRIIAHNTIGQNGGGSVQWEFFPPQTNYEARQGVVSTSERSDRSEYPVADLYAEQFDYFSACIANQTTPSLNSLNDGIDTLSWIERAYHPLPHEAPVSI
jgi:predicted dehydrogenase